MINDFTDPRTRLLNDCPIDPDGRYVLYWMQVYKRSSHNHALTKAIELANALKLPLVVYEGLRHDYPWASDRIHTFILEGVAEKQQAFEKTGARYVFFLEENKAARRRLVAELAQDSAVVVTDDFPCFIVPHHHARLVAQVRVAALAVDGNGIIPMSLLPKEEFAARTIRPKIHRLLPEWLDTPKTPKLHVRAGETLKLPVASLAVAADDIPRLVAQCDIDHSVPPSGVYHGGEAAARKRLRHFVREILPGYDESRNEPHVDGSSRLSAYLHFGFISAHEVYHAVADSDAPQAAKDAYLEELVVRRELGYNLCLRNPHYASLDALPAWAKATMDKHAADPRPAQFSAAQIEAGETGDVLWNATQHELIKTGELHNYMRMLWGKKILEWMPTYEEAFALMEHLNNKYALDGRNPNSYAGILWCFGKHDRAWGPERPVFGTLRYLSSASWWRKVRAQAYIRQYSGLDVRKAPDAGAYG